MNNSINNNINNNINLKPNIKPTENKDTKGKFSLFTISNINTTSNEINNNNINKTETQDKSKLIQPLIKNQNNPNNNEKDLNKNLFNLQHLEEKDDKEKIKYYRCSFKQCNKVFQKQSNLKDHIRTHTGEKPYMCLYPGCGKTFSQHGNLKKHEKIHSGNKKYYCNYPNCAKNFLRVII